MSLKQATVSSDFNKRVYYVIRELAGWSILFSVFLFLFFLTLFLQAFRRLFLLAFLCNESFCHGFNILIYNKLIPRYHFRYL